MARGQRKRCDPYPRCLFILQPTCTHLTPNSRHFHIPCPFSLPTPESLSLPLPPSLSLSLVLVSPANNGRQEPMSLSSSSRPIIHAFPTEMLNLSSRLNSKLRLSRIRCVFNRAKPYMSAIAVEMQGRAGQGWIPSYRIELHFHLQGVLSGFSGA